MISCGDQNNRQTFEWASYNHSGLVHWFSIQLPNGTVCVTKYTAAGNVYVQLSVGVWAFTFMLAYKCECVCMSVGVWGLESVVIDVYHTDVCLQYQREEMHVCVCASYWVVTAWRGARWGEGRWGEVWTGDVLTGGTSNFFLPFVNRK